jgi:predicted site-specific integrase-resolvase
VRLLLQEAAEFTRVNKSTLFRAIKSGKISGSGDEHGQWRLDPAKVSHVYPCQDRHCGHYRHQATDQRSRRCGSTDPRGDARRLTDGGGCVQPDNEIDGLINALEETARTAEPHLRELIKAAAREITALRNALKTMEGLVADLQRGVLRVHPPL